MLASPPAALVIVTPAPPTLVLEIETTGAPGKLLIPATTIPPPVRSNGVPSGLVKATGMTTSSPRGIGGRVAETSIEAPRVGMVSWRPARAYESCLPTSEYDSCRPTMSRRKRKDVGLNL